MSSPKKTPLEEEIQQRQSEDELKNWVWFELEKYQFIVKLTTDVADCFFMYFVNFIIVPRFLRSVDDPTVSEVRLRNREEELVNYSQRCKSFEKYLFWKQEVYAFCID